MNRFVRILALTAIVSATAMNAQAAPVPATVPTTRILAIGTLSSPLTPDDMKTIMPGEVRQTVALYLDGKIDQWWFRQDGKGVVFLVDSSSTAETEAMLEKLPLGVAKRMTFQFIPLGPLNPLRLLMHSASPAGETDMTLGGADAVR